MFSMANIAAAFQLVTGRVWKVGSSPILLTGKLLTMTLFRDVRLAVSKAAPNFRAWSMIT